MTEGLGVLLGPVIATVMGLVFLELNSGGLPGGWPPVIRIAAAVTAAGLLIAILRAGRRSLTAPDNVGFTDRRYRAIVGFEAAALFGGLVVINAGLGRPELAVAWIAVVVGAHFFALARVWPTRSFHVLATVMVILGVSGLVLGAFAAPAGVIGLVSGVGSGVALFATVAATLVGSTRAAGTRSSRVDKR